MKQTLFIAITPPQNIKEGIQEIEKKLQKKGFPVKWEEPEKIHITLAFLGNPPQEIIPKIKNALSETAQVFAPFELSLAGLGYFYNKKEDSIIFVPVLDPQRYLKDLRKTLSDKLSQEQFAITRHFTPHITIGRLKRTRHPHETKEILSEIAEQDVENAGKFMVTNLNLYRSQDGYHRVLAGFTLGNKE